MGFRGTKVKKRKRFSKINLSSSQRRERNFPFATVATSTTHFDPGGRGKKHAAFPVRKHCDTSYHMWLGCDGDPAGVHGDSQYRVLSNAGEGRRHVLGRHLCAHTQQGGRYCTLLSADNFSANLTFHDFPKSRGNKEGR